MERGSGILMHISELPSPYGIGTFGASARRFVRFLARAKQKYWQILPINPLGPGWSPYMTTCSEAIETRYICLDYLKKEVHEKIEKGEMLSAEDLNTIYYQLNQKYFGNDIVIDKEIQYEWSRIPHFYTDFYVYKYATGISAAICIATKILNKEEGFVEKYIHMLSQGCTKKSVDLLKMVDVDLENPQTYELTTQFYKDKIDELKSLI